MDHSEQFVQSTSGFFQDIQTWFILLYILPVFLVIVFLIMIGLTLGSINRNLKYVLENLDDLNDKSQKDKSGNAKLLTNDSERKSSVS